MAVLNIRPNSDVSLNHSTNTSSAGYLLINDTSPDDNTSYIYQEITSTSSSSKTSQFKFQQSSLLNVEIEAITLYVRAMCTSSNDQTATISFSCGSSTKSNTNLTNSYANYSLNLTVNDLGLTKIINGKQNFSPTFSITTTGKKYSSKRDDFNICVTQAYIAIRYKNIFPIYIGENRIEELYIGNNLVSEIYKGDTKIYG